ncbi:MAG TPA: TMEM165/GDT1 family protein [Gemmatimonadaceae bacterium]|nr:TMEM165/GDT1 family protein [Gemmatimonadaceae bacterium]
MIEIFIATYAAVFVAEIVGDKLLYTTGVLATRYHSVSVVGGMALAFMCKMGAAVAVGEAISHLPRPLVATVTGASFIGVAFTLWRKPDVRKPKEKDSRVLQGAMVAFAAIFFSEWGDVGMITAAAMAAKYVTPATLKITTGVVVWLGAVAAMVTKGTLVTWLGAGVRTWIATRISPKVVRYVGTVALLVLGVLSVLETLGVLKD